MNWTRRSWIASTLAALASYAALGAMRAWAGTRRLAVPLDKAAKLKAVGGSETLKVKDRQIIFVRETETTVVALGAVCTHKQCIVGYNAGKKRIECPCHGSAYELTGKVISGPAPRALESYPAELDRDRVIVDIQVDE